MMSKYYKCIMNKRGSEMVEASLSMPIVIIAILLLLRLLVFYIQILTTSIDEHNAAWEAWNQHNDLSIKKYEHSIQLDMIKGGLLHMNISKKYHTQIYMYNEDCFVRLGEIVKE